jgi:hypothetical protein
MEHVGSTHQQIEIVVDEFPVLQGWRMVDARARSIEPVSQAKSTIVRRANG